MANFLVYGANGYTGDLIAREAVKRKLTPILAGRNEAAITKLADELHLEKRIFALDETAALDDALTSVAVVLHCAGPFSRTWRPMVEACLRTKTHYLDITGEIAVYEGAAALTNQAKDNGVMLLPGVGFDVVPSDCLAAHVHGRLPGATHLALGFSSRSRVSRGTANTIVENFAAGGMVRRDGKIQQVPAAWKTRTIDFGRGERQAITIAWGDVSTAYYSTGIPNIEVYLAAPTKTRVAAKLSRFFGWLLRTSFVQNYLKKRIQAGPPGPTDEQREQGWSLLWGEATDASGHKVVSRLRGPEGYTMTMLAALLIVERVLQGQAPPGFQTPSLAYGADLVMDIPGVERTDE